MHQFGFIIATAHPPHSHPFFDVMKMRVHFGVKIPAFVLAVIPLEVELALRVPAFEPVEAHVHQFGIFGNHGLLDETVGGRVVGGCLGGWLQMAHFLQDNA